MCCLPAKSLGKGRTKLVQGDNSFVRLSPGVSNYIATNTNLFPSFDSGVHMIDDKNVEDANPMFPDQIKKAHKAVMNAKKKHGKRKFSFQPLHYRKASGAGEGVE